MTDKMSTAREWLEIADRRLGEPDSDGATDALLWSVATSLADIADALKEGNIAPPVTLKEQVMEAHGSERSGDSFAGLPYALTDSRGDTWFRLAGRDRYVKDAWVATWSLSEIRDGFGVATGEWGKGGRDVLDIHDPR